MILSATAWGILPSPPSPSYDPQLPLCEIFDLTGDDHEDLDDAAYDAKVNHPLQGTETAEPSSQCEDDPMTIVSPTSPTNDLLHSLEHLLRTPDALKTDLTAAHLTPRFTQLVKNTRQVQSHLNDGELAASPPTGTPEHTWSDEDTTWGEALSQCTIDSLEGLTQPHRYPTSTDYRQSEGHTTPVEQPPAVKALPN